MVECKYRGRVIGWLIQSLNGQIAYRTASRYTEADVIRIRMLEIWRGR